MPNNANLNLYEVRNDQVQKNSVAGKYRINIYGIIFGAKHPRAVDKFLSIAWNINEINGCANYDIDDDNIKRIQGDLFEGHQLSRIEKFQKTLTEEILQKKLCNNEDVYNSTLDQGHIPQHSAVVLRRLKKEKKFSILQIPR